MYFPLIESEVQMAFDKLRLQHCVFMQFFQVCCACHKFIDTLHPPCLVKNGKDNFIEFVAGLSFSLGTFIEFGAGLCLFFPQISCPATRYS